MVGPVKISYVCQGVPPYGVVEFAGDMQLLANGDRAVSAQVPTGKGPYAIDDGKGTGGTDARKYGTAIIPYDNVAWVAWDGTDPGEAWKGEVGPSPSLYTMGRAGRGYYYAGVKDQENNRILVAQKPPSAARMICVTLASPDNAWVYRPIASNARTTFRAAIVESDTVSTVQELLDPANKFVLCDVDTRFIAGGIFTGNEFMGIKNVDTRPGATLTYDVVANPALYRFKAKIGSGGVKIQFTQYLRNTASRTVTCTTNATNDTGRSLSEGQNVWVEWTQDGWHITDFECSNGPPS
jgi:hypothetical protein